MLRFGLLPSMRDNWYAWPLLLGLMLFHLWCNALVLERDATPVDVHHAGSYHLNCQAFAQTLEQHPRKWLRTVSTWGAVYPPGLCYPALALHHLGCTSMDGQSLWIGSVTLALGILALFFLGRALGGPHLGLIAAWFYAFSPGIYAYSRLYLMALQSEVLLLWALYAVWKSARMTRVLPALALGLLVGLGMLTTTYFALTFLGCGAAVVLLRRERSVPSGGWRRAILPTALAATLCCVCAAPWYFEHLPEVLQQLREDKPTVLFTSALRIDFVTFGRLWWEHQVGGYLGALTLLSVLWLGVRRRLPLWLPSVAAWPYLCYSILVLAKSTRYTLVLVPVGALLLSMAWRDILGLLVPRKPLVAAGLTLLFLAPPAVQTVRESSEVRQFTYGSFDRQFFSEGLRQPYVLTEGHWSLEQFEPASPRRKLMAVQLFADTFIPGGDLWGVAHRLGAQEFVSLSQLSAETHDDKVVRAAVDILILPTRPFYDARVPDLELSWLERHLPTWLELVESGWRSAIDLPLREHDDVRLQVWVRDRKEERDLPPPCRRRRVL
ncbi:MAG: hypothetical protein A2284_06335 [Deltaproteobacteria bacterium RIFOXYA12_FULL_61_11]|nr:MAG: hypothetical protein A2284_06335 [Deltaproteobacteria bacterium RIFOXYA12_FULL_61_11]